MQPAVAGRAASARARVRVSVLVCLLLAAAFLLGALGQKLFSPADAQTLPIGQGAGDGVFVVAGQVARDTWGLFLVDHKQKTICVYRFMPGDRKLRLMAARTYRYDVQLDDYNTDTPKPPEVKRLVEQHRRLGDTPDVK